MVNTRNPALTPATIEEMKRKGFNQSQIAEYFGVTRSYVSWVKHNKSGNFSQTARERVMSQFPWEVGARFHDASPNKRMRDHAEYMATMGEGMSEDKLQRLLWFYRYLEENRLVVEFDPDIPPSDGIKTGGFAYRPRQNSDGDLIIRLNDYTRMTAEGRKLWRFPRKWPQVHLSEDGE